MACVIGCKITLIAFFGLFSTVNFYMHPQIARLRGCILTLVALVWPITLASFCHSYRTLYIDTILTQIITFWILVHHYFEKSEGKGIDTRPCTSDVPWVLVLSNSNWMALLNWKKWKWKRYEGDFLKTAPYVVVSHWKILTPRGVAGQLIEGVSLYSSMGRQWSSDDL